jgi:hypothetical protein
VVGAGAAADVLPGAGTLAKNDLYRHIKISVLAGVIAPVNTMVQRDVSFIPASSEGLVLAGNLSHSPAQLV